MRTGDLLCFCVTYGVKMIEIESQGDKMMEIKYCLVMNLDTSMGLR